MIPIVGLTNAPSGLASTQVILKSYVTVAASAKCVNMGRSIATRGRHEREMAIVRLVAVTMCFCPLKTIYVDVGFRWGSGGRVFWIFNLDREREEEEMIQRTRCRGAAKTIARRRLVSQ